MIKPFVLTVSHRKIRYNTHSMNQLVIIAHDIRSTHNVGSLLRTAECLGVEHVYLTGYSPYPSLPNDSRLPHIHKKLSKDIHKTALGAEHLIDWSHEDDIFELIQRLKNDSYSVVALEQTAQSIPLPEYLPSKKLCIILGREVEGIDHTLISACDAAIEIPQAGQKESLNVVQAAAIAIYHCTACKT